MTRESVESENHWGPLLHGVEIMALRAKIIVVLRTKIIVSTDSGDSSDSSDSTDSTDSGDSSDSSDSTDSSDSSDSTDSGDSVTQGGGTVFVFFMGGSMSRNSCAGMHRAKVTPYYI